MFKIPILLLSYNRYNCTKKSLNAILKIQPQKLYISSDGPKFPNNLFPRILNFCIGKIKYLPIYGNNYPTKDGTAIRDYIHILDLVEAHIQTIKSLKKKKFEIFNVGTGNGLSVLEIIKKFEEVNHLKININYKKKDLERCQ